MKSECQRFLGPSIEIQLRFSSVTEPTTSTAETCILPFEEIEHLLSDWPMRPFWRRPEDNSRDDGQTPAA